MNGAFPIIGTFLLVALHHGAQYLAARLLGVRMRWLVRFPDEPTCRWKRLAALLCGSAANLVAASALVFAVAVTAGPSVAEHIRVADVTATGPAGRWLLPGDVLLAVDGEELRPTGPSLTEIIQRKQGAAIRVTLRRGGLVGDVFLAPIFDEVSRDWRIYVRLELDPERRPLGVEVAALRAAAYPSREAGRIAAAQVARLTWSPRPRPDLVGPVGIVQTLARPIAWPDQLELLALLSIYVALIYLLPLPPFDGWRLGWLAIDVIRARRARRRTR